MGLLKSLFGHQEDDWEEEEDIVPGNFPELYNGITLNVETREGTRLLTGQMTKLSGTAMTIERLPGGLSFKTCEAGAPVMVKGLNKDMTQFYLEGAVEESTRTVCRLKDLRVKTFPEQRHNFRLQINVPAALYYQTDENCENPEECVLVDISTGGACLESEYLHAEDEVLRLKVKLEDYSPMEFLGEIIRVTEYKPGKFRYAFLFAQLKENELTELTRTLYNVQVGNRKVWSRSEAGDWG